MFIEILRDVRLAARRLAQRPGFAVAAILTLALGLGANIAIFTLVRATMLQHLPVARPDELVRLGDNDNCCVNSGLQTEYSLFSYGAYLHLRDRVPGLASLAAFQASLPAAAPIRRAGTTVTESTPAKWVSANYFTTFGVRAAAGRLLDPADDNPGAEPVFVLSHRAWFTRYGADPSIIGAAFLVFGKPMTLVGVADEEFVGETIGPDPAAAWLPLTQEPYGRGGASLLQRDQDWLYLVGRLAPGATRMDVGARATAELQAWLGAQSFLTADDRKKIGQQRITVVSAAGGVTMLRYAYARPLTLLFATSVLVLLIAAANLANLLLARTDPAQVAIQTALGASAWRLIRQSLSEGLLISIAGAAIGLVVASFSTRAAVALTFAGAQYLPLDVRPDAAVLAFAFGLAVVTGALFSAAPAWAMARANPSGALAGAGRSAEQRSFLPRRSLVVAQVALSLVLLAGAGLLTESLRRLEQQPLGFSTDGRIVARINPAAAPVDDLNRLAAYYDRMLARLRQIPGVLDATYARYSPMEGNNWQSGISILGRPAAPQPETTSWNRIGPRYFETLSTRVIRGRTIDDRDSANAPRVAVVNEAFVRRFFPDADPIGQRFGIGGPDHAGDFEIVGITEDVKYTAAQRPTRPMAFLPALQVAAYEDASAKNVQLRSLLMGAVILRVAPGTTNMEPMLRQAFAEIDADLTLIRVLPMATQVSLNFRLSRLMARLTAAYGLLALVVAAIGLYGVTAYAVARRTREIGVRMALGANRSRVLAEVLRGALTQTGVGLLVGLPLALLATSALASLLFGVSARDPFVFVQAALVLLLSTAVAAVLPARRAASIDPARALRTD